MMQSPAKPNRQAGFTIFELLVVLSIIALLGTLVAPRVVGYLSKAKSDVAEAQLGNLVTSLELYALDVGIYPTAEDGLDALLSAPTEATGWAGPYLRDEDGLLDPWGRPYIYSLNDRGNIFTISTLGRDGVDGGDGENADLSKS